MESQTTAELAILIALNSLKERMYTDDHISKKLRIHQRQRSFKRENTWQSSKNNREASITTPSKSVFVTELPIIINKMDNMGRG